ncbi:Raucaffricine-O-beta-D-glucosidase [Sesamum alatum]|uniref:Raucaffricine-O-beta-D-glucosidase n=1 Tax=Sesamum alatum TaxID=300844 RepID=A0AAE2C8Q0_9LAMI|nr:Raucaffricine-O-beta-D-glucosidase [Sesamum alatum]
MSNLQDNTGITRGDFPDGFIFGTGTSAYQVEGAVAKGGRSISVWDDLTLRTPNMITGGSNGNVACDVYHRYKEDIRLMKQMGFDSYRFSISWPRVLPGMKPFVTLFHWDIPNCLQLEYGGMLSEKVKDDFVEFAELCFQEFGDRVKFWTTVNEPWTYAVRGYTPGDDFSENNCADKQRSPQEVRTHLPPHRLSTRISQLGSPTQTTRDTWFVVNDPAKDAYTVARNLLLCHSAAVQSYRTNFQSYQNGQIGIVLNSSCHYPFDSTSQDDKDAVKRAFDFMIGWFLEPVLYGQFPASMLDYAKGNIEAFNDEEKQGLAGSVDYVGLNYYTSDFVAYEKDPPGVGYPADQHCIYSWVADKNDCGLTAKQACNDTTRVEYHQNHLMYLLKAIQGLGVDVRGYFAWSYCDNFEWTDGYASRFGIIYIDYVNNLTRYMKKSAFWFIKFLKGSATSSSTLKKSHIGKDSEHGSKKRKAI